MAYRKRTRISKKLQEAMQRGRERARMERPAPEYPPELPELRREIIIRDHDHGPVEHKIERCVKVLSVWGISHEKTEIKWLARDANTATQNS